MITDPIQLVEPGTLAPLWEEREQRRREQEARAKFEAKARQNPAKLALGDVLECVEDHPCLVDSVPTLVKKGSVVLASSEIPKHTPRAWKPAKR